MDISLKPYFKNFIAQQISIGRFQNANEVIAEALALLDKQQAHENEEELRQAIQEGLDSPVSRLDMNAIKIEARKRAAAKGFNFDD